MKIFCETHDSLRKLAAQENTSMNTILDRAIEDYRRKRFLEAANNAYAALRSDEQAWQEEQAERNAWDATLSDDIEDERDAWTGAR